MTSDELTRLKKEKNAVLLAHNYQPGEVQEAAHYIGDSFELAKIAPQCECDTIVFCGVDFMAESAATPSPEKTVLLPVLDASCLTSHMITAEDVRNLRVQYQAAAAKCYVNASAAVKGESDVCCTSANAVNIANRLDVDQIIFVPDRNLAHYVQMWTEKELIAWQWYCPTHESVTVQDIEARRQAMPDIEVIVHPECRPEVIEVADVVCGTSGMLRHARMSTAKRMLIGTEIGMLIGCRRITLRRRSIHHQPIPYVQTETDHTRRGG